MLVSRPQKLASPHADPRIADGNASGVQPYSTALNADWTVHGRGVSRSVCDGRAARTEVLHHVQPDRVLERGCGRVEHEADGHERARADHAPLAAEERDLDEHGAEEHAGHARERDQDAARVQSAGPRSARARHALVAVRRVDRDVLLRAALREDLGEERAGDGEAPVVWL
jgi:hypothetical protein